MLALYRKYRPKKLSEVIGQEQVTSPLETALKNDKVSHSYIFTGPRGCGKTSVARILAHEINGFSYELEDSYLDIIEIDAASNTGVDNIRELREKAIIAPSEGKYKVYIIDEVHMLSKPAFNALLKTLEEPPAHVVFILATTDLEKVPVTITSRSQVYTFHLASEEIMLPHLKTICEKEKIKITDDALKIICEKGGGSFRDSLSLLDQISTLSEKGKEILETDVANCLGLPLESKLRDLLEAYKSRDFESTSSQIKSLLMEGVKPETIANSVLSSIIKTPEFALLPLLSELPKVSAPYPEAKLLLAFLGNTFISAPSKQLIKPQTKLVSKSTEVTKPKPAPVQEPETKPETTPSIPLTLTPAIEQQLKRCKIKDDGETIHIFPSKQITKTILTRPANSAILKSNFDKPFIIHDPDELQKSPELQKISDIMGTVQEVNNENGGIPF